MKKVRRRALRVQILTSYQAASAERTRQCSDSRPERRTRSRAGQRDKEPDVRFIITENAGPNDHMIAINEQLGFEVVSVHRHWDVDTDEASAR